MKKKNGILLFILSALFTLSVHPQVYIRAVYPDGNNYPDDHFTRFDRLWLSREQPPLFFRADSLAGPAILIDNEKLELEAEEINPYKFYAVKDRVKYSLFIRPNIAARSFIIEVEMKKNSHKEAAPHDVSILLGFDIGNSLDRPSEEVYYPTILRQEENTLWGCFTTPGRKMFAVACPGPVERISYLQFDQKTQTIKIDLLAKENFRQMEYNETVRWAFSLAAVPENDCLKNVILDISGIPTIDLKRTYYFIGETVTGRIHTKAPVKLTLTAPDGSKTVFERTPQPKNPDAEEEKSEPEEPPTIPFAFEEMTEPGVYLLSVQNEKGQTTSAGFSVFRDPHEIIRQEAERAVKTPIPQTSDEICYADILAATAGALFPEFKEISEKRITAIKNIFVQPQLNKLNLNAVKDPESGFLLLNLALISNDLNFANLISDYFSKMQLPSGNIFYPDTKEDLTASPLLLSSFMAMSHLNQKAGKTEEAELCRNVLIKALTYLKNKKPNYDESYPPTALISAKQFLELSEPQTDFSNELKTEFFLLGAKLLKAAECHIQKENASPYFHSAYSTPLYAGVSFPTDPTAVYLKAATAFYEKTGCEEDLVNALNAMATLINRSRESQYKTAHNYGIRQHCRFQAPLLLYEFLFDKAYIYAESPEEVRGYHCRIESTANGTVNVVVPDESVRRIHIRTLEPLRFVFETAGGRIINKVAEQSGWIDLN